MPRAPATSSGPYDAAIVGAGLSGLAAGVRLAHFGLRVLVLERHTTIGGLNSFYRREGRNFDVGLHAVTNFAPPGTRRGPLAFLLKQLRLGWDDFRLAPQLGSAIVFPGLCLRFDNDPALLLAEVARLFPAETDGLARLIRELPDYAELRQPLASRSARQVVGQYLRDPLLAEMLFCPLMYYGSAREDDMDFGQFCIMFRSVFLEGFGRPRAGVRPILKALARRFKALGGELRLRAGVRRLESDSGRVAKVVLDDGSQLSARYVLSSAGWVETMDLCRGSQPAEPRAAGRLSFVESLSVLDRQPRELDFSRAVVFFNDHSRFVWRRPEELIDVRSGVICSPNNFAYDAPPGEGMIRVTALANFDRWQALPEAEYRQAKRRAHEQMTASAARFVPDFRGAVIATDLFTPRTIRRFTGHENGAVYGAPRKQWDGRTHLENLFICGTDQGYVGIVGAMVSGITMANQHVLRAAGSA